MQWLSCFAFQKTPAFFIRTNTAHLWYAIFYFLQHVLADCIRYNNIESQQYK